MKTKISLLALIVFVRISIFAQDIHFSQFYMSPLTQNPAMAGVNYNFQALLNYKDQWRGVTTPFKTFAASVDARLGKKTYKDSYWAGGLNFFSDRAGDAKMGISQANITAAYHLGIATYQTLGIGLQGGFAQRSINYTALKWANQYDPSTGYNPDLASGEPETISSFSYGDLGAGIVWSYNNTAGLRHVEDNHDLKFTLGAAVYHYRQPYSFYKASREQLYPKYVLHGNSLISMPNNHNFALLPGFVFYSQGSAKEWFFGSLIRYNMQQESKYTGLKKSAAVYLGGYYRAKDAFTLAFLVERSPFSLGLSYDVNLSKLTPASNARGGLELSLRYAPNNQFKSTTRANMPKPNE
jgi:type IX secretion system PorP/SprF family membrane protein